MGALTVTVDPPIDTGPPDEETASPRNTDPGAVALIWIEPPAVREPLDNWSVGPSRLSGPVAVTAIEVAAVIGAASATLRPVMETAPVFETIGALRFTTSLEYSTMLPPAVSGATVSWVIPPAPAFTTSVPLAVTEAGGGLLPG